MCPCNGVFAGRQSTKRWRKKRDTGSIELTAVGCECSVCVVEVNRLQPYVHFNGYSQRDQQDSYRRLRNSTTGEKCQQKQHSGGHNWRALREPYSPPD